MEGGEFGFVEEEFEFIEDEEEKFIEEEEGEFGFIGERNSNL